MKREIPGYYYDEVKKKYFKLTKEYEKTLKQKSNQISIGVKASANLLTKLNKRNINGFTCLHSITQQCFLQKLYQSNWRQDSKILPTTSHLPLTTRTVNMSPYGNTLTVSGRLSRSDEVILTYDVKSHRPLIQISEFKIGGGKVDSLAWSPNRPDEFIMTSSGLVNSTAWVTLCQPHNEYYCILFQNQDINYRCVNWSWYDKNMIAVSSLSKYLFLHDVNRNSMLAAIHTGRADSIAFSKYSNCLLVGCHDGDVKCLDYRAKSFPTKCFNNKNPKFSSIDCVRYLRDENFIVVSDLSGQMLQLDLRMRKSIVNYQGHVNNHYPINFSFNSSESLLFSIGSDSQLRVWNLKTGKIEMSKPLLLEEHKNGFIPSLTFTPNMHGINGKEAVVIGYGDKYNIHCLS